MKEKENNPDMKAIDMIESYWSMYQTSLCLYNKYILVIIL